MDYGDIERQAREMEDNRQRGHESTVQKRMQDLGISREFAEYLLNLETKISELERRPR